MVDAKHRIKVVEMLKKTEKAFGRISYVIMTHVKRSKIRQQHNRKSGGWRTGSKQGQEFRWNVFAAVLTQVVRFGF